MRPLETKRPQPWPVRLLHWAMVPLMVIMAGSGLQILVAYPYMGPMGEQWSDYPLQGFVPPGAVRIGGWLAGGRNWHFAFMWPLTLAGLAYGVWLCATGEWRRRLFLPKRDLPSAWRTAFSYLRLRNPPASRELYNGLQRFAYTSILALAIIEVLSGLVLYKPVQLDWLAMFFGGYDGARLVHFIGLALLALLTLGHVTLVLLHPAALRDMITGGKRP